MLEVRPPKSVLWTPEVTFWFRVSSVPTDTVMLQILLQTLPPLSRNL